MALSKIQADSMNLADTYAFTGTVTGAGGGILGQVVQATTDTAVNVASTSYTNTGLSVNITPTATTSKILVQVNQNVLTDIDTQLGNSRLQLRRDSTSVIGWTNQESNC